MSIQSNLTFVVFVAFLVGISACASPEASVNDTPPVGVPDFTVVKELSTRNGFGAELRVSNSTSKKETLALGEWLLRGSHDANYRIYDSSGQIALVRRGGVSGPEGFTSWLKDRPYVETTYSNGRVEETLSLSMDSPFELLKENSFKLDYEELYRNFDKYSIVTWRENGGPTPLIYYEGELQSNEKLTGILDGVWAGQLLLSDGNFIVFTYDESILMVGDRIEFVGVCEELKTFQTVGAGSKTVPYCFAWQVRR